MKKVVFWLHRFVVAYGIIMLSTFFMCLLFNPASELPVVSFFGRCILFTLVCMATLVVYYSRTELTDPHDRACGLTGGGLAAPCAPLGILVRTVGCGHLRRVYSGGKDPLASDQFRPEHPNGYADQ